MKLGLMSSRFSYRRLQQEGIAQLDDEELISQIGKLRLSSTFRPRRRPAAVHLRRRLKVKIPSLKRFLKRKARVVRIGWRKIVKRLKESQSHFGDLFAGNYLFLQVTPTAPYNKKPANYCFSHHHDHQHRLSTNSHLYSVAKMV